MARKKMQLDLAIALIGKVSPADKAREATLELVSDNVQIDDGLKRVHELDIGLEMNAENVLSQVAHVLLVTAALEAVIRAVVDPHRVRGDVIAKLERYMLNRLLTT